MNPQNKPMKNPTLAIKTPILLLFTLFCAAVASLQIVHAATFTVINTNDSGPGSLRQAIAGAAPGDTIDFNLSGCPCTITLTSGELVINKPLTISGPGARALSINGANASRVFYINALGTVTLSGMTITNGNGVGRVASGFGGAILGITGPVIISDCAIVGNRTAISGGGAALVFGVFQMTGCTISGNMAFAAGGAHIQDSIASLTNCTISGNTATANTGAIGVPGTARITDLTLTNCSVTGNSAATEGGVTVNSSNTVVVTAKLKNTLAAGNSPKNFSTNVFGSGSATLTTLGYNLDGDGSSGFINGSNGDLVGTMSNPLNAMLGPLANNGGPTDTHALLSGSPAIDAGDPNFSPPTNYDQRGPGFSRVVNGRIDIGAFEVAPCPLSQGYWKNHPDAWTATSLMLGSQTYTKAELLTILNTPIGTGQNADASLILADQLIATKLNVENGSNDPAPVPATIIDADAVLSLYPGTLPYRVRANSTNGQQMVNDAATLESYNTGFLTPGCGG
jgi:hypothetical protein